MLRHRSHHCVFWHRHWLVLALLWICGVVSSAGQQAPSGGMPRVVVPGGGAQTKRPAVPARILYPWKTHITCSIFWVGEQPTANNPVPNCKSSWDTEWMKNFGGYDNPDPAQRIADFLNGDFRPKAFVPKLNPFYVALPYNDMAGGVKGYKPEASKVIPWFRQVSDARQMRSVCKGRWVQIFHNNRSCYAQWEDCGPWVTDDWPYVFGNRKPANTKNQAAGIDISPSVRDYLKLKSMDKIHWRFVEDSQVPYGPWKKYGQAAVAPAAGAANPSLDAERQYLEYLRKLRDEQFLKRPLRESQY